MQEIRFHGRGGQGTVVASILLAKAYFRAGYYVQSFPLFGVERRGAPVEAYLRLDRKKILIRSNIYTPDHIIVQDANLLENIDVTKGLKPEGWILINAPGPPEKPEAFSSYRLAYVDATHIALKNDLGTRTHPIINTAMIGAFARIMGEPSMDMISEAIKEEIAIQPENNIQASEAAYESVNLFEMVD
jgi:pyruvate ferredoxin oxidoreductase gamma subunit/2-oxoisovalerate ferredoxin oxidoreductase gamma subunit